MRTETAIRKRIEEEMKKAAGAQEELNAIRRKKDYYKDNDLKYQINDIDKYINVCNQNVYVLEWALGEREI